MKKSDTDQQQDLLTAPYKGASRTIEAVGRGSINHLKYAFEGMLGAGLIGFVFNEKAAIVLEKFCEWGTILKKENPNKIKDKLGDWGGWFLHLIAGDKVAASDLRELADHGSGLSSGNVNMQEHIDWLNNVSLDKKHGFGRAFLTHTLGLLPIVGSRFVDILNEASPRMNTAIATGGAAGLIGYVGGWGGALFHGATSKNAGEEQHRMLQKYAHQLHSGYWAQQQRITGLEQEVHTYRAAATATSPLDVEKPAVAAADISPAVAEQVASQPAADAPIPDHLPHNTVSQIAAYAAPDMAAANKAAFSQSA